MEMIGAMGICERDPLETQARPMAADLAGMSEYRVQHHPSALRGEEARCRRPRRASRPLNAFDQPELLGHAR